MRPLYHIYSIYSLLLLFIFSLFHIFIVFLVNSLTLLPNWEYQFAKKGLHKHSYPPKAFSTTAEGEGCLGESVGRERGNWGAALGLF